MKTADKKEFLLLISQAFLLEEWFGTCVMVWISDIFNFVLSVLQQFQSRHVFNRIRALPSPLDCIVSLPLIWGGDLKRHSMCGLGGIKKGSTVFIPINTRYEQKDDLILYFCLALTFLATVVSYLSIVRVTGQVNHCQEAKQFLRFKSWNAVTVYFYCEQIWISFICCLHK